MSDVWWSDDDRLMAALEQALRTARDVPHHFVTMAKDLYAWHNLDAELAELTYDSALEASPALTLTRAEPAPLRSFTFAGAQLTIELEVTQEKLVGQIIPPQSGQVELQLTSGPGRAAPIDEVGRFVIRPIPTRSFRLLCQTADGARVLTDWVAL
jgi:hypothetical protein